MPGNTRSFTRKGATLFLVIGLIVGVIAGFLIGTHHNHNKMQGQPLYAWNLEEGVIHQVLAYNDQYYLIKTPPSGDGSSAQVRLLSSVGTFPFLPEGSHFMRKADNNFAIVQSPSD